MYKAFHVLPCAAGPEGAPAPAPPPAAVTALATTHDGSRLFAGTAQGALLMYHVSRPAVTAILDDLAKEAPLPRSSSHASTSGVGLPPLPLSRLPSIGSGLSRLQSAIGSPLGSPKFGRRDAPPVPPVPAEPSAAVDPQPPSSPPGSPRSSTLPRAESEERGSAASVPDDWCVLVDTIADFAKKPVDALRVSESANLLFSIVDGFVRLHTLDTFELVHTFQDVRAPASFDLCSPSAPNEPLLLALGFHKKVVLATVPRDGAAPTTKEYPVPVSVRGITFMNHGTTVAIASSKELSVLTLETGEFVSLYSWFAGSSATSFTLLSGTPITRIAAYGSELLAFNNQHVLRLDDSIKTRFDWGAPLADLVRCGPYLVGLNAARTALQVKVGQAPVQTFDVPAKCTTLAVTHASSAAGAAVAAMGGLFYASPGRPVTFLLMIPLDAQLARLIHAAEFDAAIVLVEASELPLDEKMAHQCTVQTAYAHHLFQAGQFDDAMAAFRDLCLPPEPVLAYFLFTLDDNLATPQSSEGEAAAAPPPPPPLMTPQTHHLDSKRPYPEIPEARRALVRFLTERRSILGRLRSAAAAAQAGGAGQAQQGQNWVGNGSVFGGVGGGAQSMTMAPPHRSGIPRVMSSSSSSLSSLARDVLTRMSNDLTPDEIEKQSTVVDMALVRVYLRDKSDVMLGSLLRIKNSCPIDATAALLLRHHKYSELVDFYSSKSLHDQALDLLMRKAMEGTTSSLSGPRALLSYLYKLDGSPEHNPIVFKYLGWVFQVDPAAALEFVQDCRIEASQLVHFLMALSPRYVVAYLDFLIFTQQKSASVLHEAYVRSLIELVQLEQADEAAGTDRDGESSDEEFGGGDEEEQDDDDAAGRTSGIPPPVAGAVVGDDTPAARLVKFLKSSDAKYQPESVLAMFPATGFWEEKLAVYRRLGDIDRALQLLVEDLRAVDGAVELVREAQSHHVALVELCVAAPWCPRPTILDLLAEFGDHMPPASVLELVTALDPEAHLAYPIVARAFARIAAQVHRSSVVRALAQREHDAACIRLAALQCESAVVEDRTLCPVCGKRIGNSAIVTSARSPASVVHFACATTASASGTAVGRRRM
ncbi:Vacuolar morphogenesis protein 6 [Blastocladiella emersonii ATCC 22665]|nr:Vacuolar morphogenesis protein 6 [Blastocladiella emersonii ATCC 22665]